MAGLPWIIPVPEKGHFQFTPIHVRDLAQTVRLACEVGRFDNRVLEPVGPQTLSLRDLLERYRRWLGFGRARIAPIPMPFMRLFARIGDFLGTGPITTTSLNQMIAGNAGDSAGFAKAIRFQPRSLEAALQAQPAQVQDRWHARLFFLAPAIRAILVLLWLSSAALGLWAGEAATAHFVSAAGLSDGSANPLRIGTAMLDILVAGLVLTDSGGRRSTPVQLIVILAYTVVLGIALPRLWLDPLGPLLKNLPILVLVLVHGAISDKR
jgi:hypothetical protein